VTSYPAPLNIQLTVCSHQLADYTFLVLGVIAGVANPIFTLQQNAILEIKKLIVEGELKFGQRINEVELSQLLNMSRGPIRESMQILYQQGLLTYKPRKGMYVTNLTKEDIKELFDIQLLLEKSSVELGFANINETFISRVRSIVNEFQNKSIRFQKNTLVKLDTDFHREIVSLPNYNMLINTWSGYNALLALAFAKIFEYETETAEDLVKEHKFLIEVIEKRDKDLLIQSLTNHYEQGKLKLLDVWK